MMCHGEIMRMSQEVGETINCLPQLLLSAKLTNPTGTWGVGMCPRRQGQHMALRVRHIQLLRATLNLGDATLAIGRRNGNLGSSAKNGVQGMSINKLVSENRKPETIGFPMKYGGIHWVQHLGLWVAKDAMTTEGGAVEHHGPIPGRPCSMNSMTIGLLQ